MVKYYNCKYKKETPIELPKPQNKGSMMKKPYFYPLSALAIFLMICLMGGEQQSCEPTLCGNGIIDDGEECDYGDLEGCDGCSATCLLEPEEMVCAPSGSFEMSHITMFDPPHEVTLTHDTYISPHEVTNAQYRDALQWAFDKDYVLASPESSIDSESGEELLDMVDPDCLISFSEGLFSVLPGKEDYPVVEVTWYGAACYCDWLSMMEGLTPLYDHVTWECDVYGTHGYRLPTDAEWEYVVRYDDERTYPWGEVAPTCEYANFYDGDYCITNPDGTHQTVVGSYPLGASALGAFDMAGNVWEWMNDWYNKLSENPQTDPTGPVCGLDHVYRGGSFGSMDQYLLSYFRDKGHPSYSYHYLGFRTALTF